MEIIKIKPQSIILLVAPTNAGKTYFCENVLIPQLKEQYPQGNIQHLSSDNFRREVIGYNPFLDSTPPLKNDYRMNFASEQAFALLKTKLQAVTSYPINADFVIVDTTGMSQEFRKEVSQVAYDSNYLLQVLLFDFKNRDDYFKYAESDDAFARKNIADSVKRFKEKLSELTKKDYPNLIKIKSNNFLETKIEIENLDYYKSYFISNNFDYLIIGDVHGCYDELKELLLLNGFEFDEKMNVTKQPMSRDGKPVKIIFIGDIIDKGEQILECIKFVYKLMVTDYALFVKGNHENFVYNYLKGEASYLQTDRNVIDTFLSTVKLLEGDEPQAFLHRELFYSLVESSRDFYTNGRFIVTHAPCKNKYLGKITQKALKAQRNLNITRLGEGATLEEKVKKEEEELAFLKEECRYNQPFHIMGHVMLSRVIQFNNKIMIDTGCVAGGKLTSLLMDSGKLYFNSVNSKRENKIADEIHALFTTREEINLDDLDPKDKTRIKYMAIDKVNFISGTMCPADKDLGSNELESLENAVKYYKAAGIKTIIFQPKHMGSRGNVYLFNDPEKCYIITRNGYKMRDNLVDKEVLHKEFQRLIDRMFKLPLNEVVSKPELFILDAEILPWRTIGKGLIDQQFTSVSLAIESETNLLNEHGFENILNNLNTNPEYVEYCELRKTMKKDELTTKFGYTKERTFRSMYEYSHLQLEEELRYAKNYSAQVELYGGEAPFKIEPFAILKVVFEDGTERTFENESNLVMFSEVSDCPFAVLDLEYNEQARIKYPELFFDVSENDYIVNVYNSESPRKVGGNTLRGFYEYITKVMKMEGLVGKPEQVYVKGVAPYLKIRNENYLTIVYGHNYKFSNKFNKLIQKKNVARKLKTSIKEFDLGLKLLKIPYNKLTPDNQEYNKLLAEMIVEVDKEKQLDPRL